MWGQPFPLESLEQKVGENETLNSMPSAELLEEKNMNTWLTWLLHSTSIMICSKEMVKI